MGKGRNIYFRDTDTWKGIEKIAKNEKESVNRILERAAKAEIEKSKQS